jgi:quinol monooxygenase YgiN
VVVVMLMPLSVTVPARQQGLRSALSETTLIQNRRFRMIDMILMLQVKTGMETRAEDLLRELEQETAENDPGCLRYQWYKAEQPNLYYLLQRWTDQKAVDAHVKAAHMARLLPLLAECAAQKATTTRLTRLV